MKTLLEKSVKTTHLFTTMRREFILKKNEFKKNGKFLLENILKCVNRRKHQATKSLRNSDNVLYMSNSTLWLKRL